MNTEFSGEETAPEEVIDLNVADLSDSPAKDSEHAEVTSRKLPYSFANTHGVLLESGSPIIVWHRSDLSFPVFLELQRYIGEPFELRSITGEAFQKRLTESYQQGDDEAAQVAEDMGANLDLSRLADEIPNTSDLMDANDDAPVIRLINAVLSQAIREQASDIHIETFENNLMIRFRVDGVLREALMPKRMLAPLLTSRLKVMAKLDIAEKRIPQDGRITVRVAGHTVDIRMSTLPSAHGERIVLRLLDTQARQLHLKELNMSEPNESSFRKALNSAHGIILVTGPTGSGKTTTLYAGLTEINQSTRNIMTIEDPVEYMLEGIAQTQVNSKVDMSFARGLRAILRQDPDIVMIGEIRDLETAEIAVQASLTGHLVLSTLHTNTAIGAITRLQDMGIETFLLSSSLIGVMAQRLVRMLCPNCREQYAPTAEQCEQFQLKTSDVLYRAVGCEQCNHTGYRGRTGIYEHIEIDDEIRAAIHAGTNEQKLAAQAFKKTATILQDGRRRILNGETTLEEVMRVTLVQ